MFDEKIYEADLEGKTLKLSTGKIARQAHGAVLLEYGGTTLLATAVRSSKPREGIDFFPLTVDFMEKFYASGKVPGGFIKRESKPSVDATLNARMIDRPMRPLFPEGFYHDVHIVVTVLSYDGENTTDHLGIIAASAAVSVSDIPFQGPVAGVIVGYKDGEYILNPSPKEREESLIELAVAGTKDAITMVEAGSAEVSEEEMLGAILYGHEKIKEIVAIQEKFVELAGKEKITFEKKEFMEEVTSFINENGKERLFQAVLTEGKHNREDTVNSLEEELLEKFTEKYEDGIPDDVLKEFKKYYHDLMKQLVREAILYKKHRVDGRKTDEIRQIEVEIDLLSRTHGSALFTRGETQALVTTTLGSKEDEQIIDGLDEEKRKTFFLHYNFPPYSVGETGFMRAPGRRELGHGNLAERALSYVMPKLTDFPYTVRVVSEITESNGSSSQASICGGSLALMSAGVPIKEHVAGIAMGLIKEGDDFVVLTDIMGLEDHLGDMDFKVAGTKKGITALQMDIKITGINKEIMKIALTQALNARMSIIEKMDNLIIEPKTELSEYAPKIHKLKIKTDKIAALIGPSGKNIKAIIEETQVKVNIEDTGDVFIYSNSAEDIGRAVKIIENIVAEVEPEKVYMGKVMKVAKFGAFMEVLPGKEGLLHISEYSHERIKQIEDVVKLGDEFEVKVISVENGKVNLSRKALIPKN